MKTFNVGDFIFAKVKGYPAWPARVEAVNGKKYFVFFYGTNEVANLSPAQVFPYLENKDAFLAKSVKRKDFNEGVRLINNDIENNVPLEETLSRAPARKAPPAPKEKKLTKTVADIVATSPTKASTPNSKKVSKAVADTTSGDVPMEDSDEGVLIIDEEKAAQKKGKKSKAETPKDAKVTKSKAKKDDEEKKEEEVVSRSGRVIRPKRFLDEETEEAPPVTIELKRKKTDQAAPDSPQKTFKVLSQYALEDMQEAPANPDDHILIAILPNGDFVGVKLFQDRPTSFKSDIVRQNWDKQAIKNAITIKKQLEKGEVTPKAIASQLEQDLCLDEEIKTSLKETQQLEEKRYTMEFFKTEKKLIELDANIIMCLGLERADAAKCVAYLNELMELDIKPLMLLKRPRCLDTIKRTRAYVGNCQSWGYSQEEVDTFTEHAAKIRDVSQLIYAGFKKMFAPPPKLSFWEYFNERVLLFKKLTADLTNEQRLELVHEPLGMDQPTSHTMQTAIDSAEKELTTQKADETPKANKRKRAQESKAESKSEAKADATPATESRGRRSRETRTKND